MTDSDRREATDSAESQARLPEDIQPSWKPLLWFGGGLVLLIALWEVFLELGMNLFELLFEVVEHVWLVLVEAPEEYLEDVLAAWLKNHFPHEADRYSEITTAIGLTPLKLLLLFLLARWGWRQGRDKLWPRVQLWVRVRIAEVRLAWAELWWPYRVLGGLVILVILLLPLGI